MRPTVLIGSLPDGPLTDEDRLLILALQQYEESLCSCGHPRDVAWDERAEGEYERQTAVCQACATAQRDGNKDEKPPAGQKAWITHLGPG